MMIKIYNIKNILMNRKFYYSLFIIILKNKKERVKLKLKIYYFSFFFFFFNLLLVFKIFSIQNF